MNEIKVNVVFTDGYQKRYTEAVAKAYQKKKHLQNRKSCFSTGIDAAERIMKEM
jgi:hypothetical protein|nr:MAG TPA: hypothetical protein [Caudoviricetes sp.]DAX63309.1 MAG TPA: hypothetical protein [Caudoviricetes sp.]